MSGAQSISARRAYGVQRVCRVWGRARSSVYVRRHATRSRASRRRGPVGAATDEVLVGHIRRVLEASPFHGEGYRKAWAKLRVERIRTSQERVRRLMREHGLQAPYRAGHAHGPKAHDGTITTAAPNVMWGTDMTSTVTGVGRASGRGGRGRRGGRHDRTACRHVATCGSTGITQGALSGARIVPHHDVTQTTGPSYPQSFGHVFTTRRGNPLSVEALRRPSILRGVDTRGRVQRRERPPPNRASCGTGGRVSLHAVAAALVSCL